MVALRAVTSSDGMTADWYPFEQEFLQHVSTKICNTVRGVNRVVYVECLSCGASHQSPDRRRLVLSCYLADLLLSCSPHVSCTRDSLVRLNAATTSQASHPGRLSGSDEAVVVVDPPPLPRHRYYRWCNYVFVGTGPYWRCNGDLLTTRSAVTSHRRCAVLGGIGYTMMGGEYLESTRVDWGNVVESTRRGSLMVRDEVHRRLKGRDDVSHKHCPHFRLRAPNLATSSFVT